MVCSEISFPSTKSARKNGTQSAGLASEQVTYHARLLQAQRYLLGADADAILLRAIESDIGRP